MTDTTTPAPAPAPDRRPGGDPRPDRDATTTPAERSMGRRLLVLSAPLVVVALVVAVVAVVRDRQHPGGAPQLEVVDSAASPGAVGEAASVYLTVNDTGGSDVLVGATSPVAGTATLHRTQAVAGGSVMVDADRLDVPAGGHLVLAPGGNHLMLEQLHQALAPGDHVSVTLRFERGGDVQVDVPVESYVDLAGRAGSGAAGSAAGGS